MYTHYAAEYRGICLGFLAKQFSDSLYIYNLFIYFSIFLKVGCSTKSALEWGYIQHPFHHRMLPRVYYCKALL